MSIGWSAISFGGYYFFNIRRNSYRTIHNIVREIEENPPVKGLFGFGYSDKKKEWDKRLASARRGVSYAREDLERYGKTLDGALSKAAGSSKEAAKSKNAEAVREIEAIDAEIQELNGDVNGIYSAARALLRKNEHHRFANARFPEADGAYRGEILGVAEYNGYAVVLQDGPIERTETERKDMYGRPEVSVSHIVWAHEISPEQAPELKALTGYVAAITVDGAGLIDLTDVLTKNQEWERPRGKGFSR
jgi:hypothetical protein